MKEILFNDQRIKIQTMNSTHTFSSKSFICLFCISVLSSKSRILCVRKHQWALRVVCQEKTERSMKSYRLVIAVENMTWIFFHMCTIVACFTNGILSICVQSLLLYFIYFMFLFWGHTQGCLDIILGPVPVCGWRTI